MFLAQCDGSWENEVTGQNHVCDTYGTSESDMNALISPSRSYICTIWSTLLHIHIASPIVRLCSNILSLTVAPNIRFEWQILDNNRLCGIWFEMVRIKRLHPISLWVGKILPKKFNVHVSHTYRLFQLARLGLELLSWFHDLTFFKLQNRSAKHSESNVSHKRFPIWARAGICELRLCLKGIQ